MPSPVVILMQGSSLQGWTSMRLSRSKDELTGTLDVNMFFNYIPSSPVAVNAAKGNPCQVYIGGNLAFNGLLDSRTGGSTQITKDEYTVKLSGRGKTKNLVDSSNQHPTTNMLKPTNRDAFTKLLEPWPIQIDWRANVHDLDKVRFRDGGRVVDELHRLATENAHFIYETRDGKLRITDEAGPETGEDLILGTNILSFSATQSEQDTKSEIKVKGQRTVKEIRGRDALNDTIKTVVDGWAAPSFVPFTVQHYGDGNADALERRGRYEANKRSSASKTITVEVFHVQPVSGEPWDIGTLHYVEIPPEGIFDVFECTGLEYIVEADKTLKTKLTLSPPPEGGSAGGSGGFSALNAIAGLTSLTRQRRLSAGVEFVAGSFPAPWSGPSLSVLANVALGVVPAGVARPLLSTTPPIEDDGSNPLLVLPENFVGENND